MEENSYRGKRFSILGDSIGTPEGYNPARYALFILLLGALFSLALFSACAGQGTAQSAPDKPEQTVPEKSEQTVQENPAQSAATEGASGAAAQSPGTTGGETSPDTEEKGEACTVRFDAGAEGIDVDSVTVGKGALIKKPAVTREGYVLRRWMCGEEVFDFETPVTSDLALRAEWLEKTNLASTVIELGDGEGPVELKAVDRTHWTDSSVTVTDAEGRLQTDGAASAFKGRGNGGWGEAKKGYTIRFEEKIRLFGCAKNRHWVLLPCSGWHDQTLMRIPTSFELARGVFDGLEYIPHGFFTDLYVNGEYQGVYLLTEQVRVGKGRIAIESEYGVEDTGFLIEYDAYARGTKGIDYFDINGGEAGQLVSYRFTVHSPAPDDYAEYVSEKEYRAQVAYIKEYVRRVYKAAIVDRDFEQVSELVDIESLVDMYILEEFFKNTDAGWSSFYLYKKPGGKLYFGPPWDFDGTTVGARGEENDPTGIYVADTCRNYTPFGNTANELFVALYQNDAFLSLVKARWQELSGKIKAYCQANFNEKFYEQNRYAFGRNFVKWQYGGAQNAQKSAEREWIRQCRLLASWFDRRIAFLDDEWKSGE